MNKNFLKQIIIGTCAVAGVCTPYTAHANETTLPLAEIVAIGTEASTTASESTDTLPTASSTEVTAQLEIVPAPITILLDIETPTETLYKGSITVAACPISPVDTKHTVNAYCAVEQAGITAKWSWYGSSAFIDSLHGIGNDYVQNNYWDWFSDLSFGTTALNEHELHAGESLLITIERMPLRLSVSPDVLSTQSTTTITVEQFGFDENFNAVWKPASESIVRINDEPHAANEAGIVLHVPTSSGTVTISASKSGFLPTAVLSTSVAASSSSQISTPIVSDDSSRGGSLSSRPRDAAVSARDFLIQRQELDGSFRNSMITDWAAMALVSAHAPTAILATYLRSSPDTLTSATDMERRTLALEALGIDPADITPRLLTQFDGTQIGDGGLINDDIFGIISLSHAGFTEKDLVIAQTIAHLLQKQSSNGSWESTDLTAAAIQALSPFRSYPGVSSALSRARSYLLSTQQENGCFGNSFTTSWGSMAISALGESPSAWRTAKGNTPLDCLRSLQASDGGFDEGAPEDTRVWATAYALPALMETTWNSLLHSFPRPLQGTVLGVQIEQTSEPVEATSTPLMEEPVTQIEEPTTFSPTPITAFIQNEARPILETPSPRKTATPLRLSESYDPTPPESLWSQFIKFLQTLFAVLGQPLAISE
ncbi:MAG: hypothetical protein KA104_01835 [Candidatus Pacebacteria bacterium]|nr:hypothetical protein [Candidatus Paceibacterota bacterium]